MTKISPEELIALVKRFAETEYGQPLGHLIWSAYPGDVILRSKWEIYYQPDPLKGDFFIQERAKAIENAITKVRAEHPDLEVV